MVARSPKTHDADSWHEAESAHWRRRRHRYALGEYVTRSRRTEIHAARARFLRIAAEVEPRLLMTLADEPLSLIRPLFDYVVGDVPDRKYFYFIHIDWNWSSFKYDDRERAATREAILRWATRFNLVQTEWCLDAAVETLMFWCASPPNSSRTDWFYPGMMTSIVISDDERRFSFESHGWQPEMEDWLEAEHRIRTAFDDALRAYEQRLRTIADERLLPAEIIGAAPKKFKDRSPDRHFRWLASYQILEESYPDIAKTAGASRSAVYAGVRELADFIGLIRRNPDARARPPIRPLSVRRQ